MTHINYPIILPHTSFRRVYRMKLVAGFYSVLKVLLSEYSISIDQYIIDGASQNSLVRLRGNARTKH